MSISQSKSVLSFVIISIIYFSGINNLTFSEFKLPSKKIMDVFNAPRSSYLSPISKTKLAIEYDYLIYPTLETISKPFLKLAGKKIDASLNSIVGKRPYHSLRIKNFENDEIYPVTIPKTEYVIEFKTSQNKKYLSYLSVGKDGIYLNIFSLTTFKHIYKSDFKINNTNNYLAMNWGVDGESMILSIIPNDRGSVPKKTAKDISPLTKESYGKISKVRTYTNLLKSEFDEKLFDYYFTSQMIKLDFKENKITKLGEPAIFRDFSLSPDGEFYLTKIVQKPYSYSVPSFRFGYKYEIWNSDGLSIKEIISKPVQDQIPTWGVETGMRYLNWISTENSTLYWAEAQDGGDPKAKVEYRDFLYKFESPFDKNYSLFKKVKERFGGISWFKEKGKYIFSENDYDKEWTIERISDLYDQNFKDRKILDISWNDKYGNPGDLLTEKNSRGYDIILENSGDLFYKGRGATKKGNFPFVDRVKKDDFKNKERIFLASENSYEIFRGFYNSDFEKLIIRRETKTDPRNYFIHDIRSKTKTKITNYIDHTPEIRKIRKELVTYQREDSLLLSGTLYYPIGYEKGKKYPLLIWAYPQEYRDASQASQVSGSDNKFTSFWASSPLYALLDGYIVLHNAAMPVVGDVIERNNTFGEQIKMNAKAAIDFLDNKEIIDRERVAVGGHSYGAFMTANLLIYSDLFKAGIARSGAYNRSLTPFGFQSERRSYWEAKDFYNKVSPFMNAEKIKTPLLLVHGQKDSNSGTYPIQSERLFDAIKGNGGTVKLVMLPYEDHGYYARESNLHVIAETMEWLNKYLKK